MPTSPAESPPALLELSVTGECAAPLVHAVGELDACSAPELHEVLQRLLEGPVLELTVDLTGVTFLDSAGLCVLAAAHGSCLENEVRFRVLAATRTVMRPLQITGLWDLLGVEQVPAGVTV